MFVTTAYFILPMFFSPLRKMLQNNLELFCYLPCWKLDGKYRYIHKIICIFLSGFIINYLLIVWALHSTSLHQSVTSQTDNWTTQRLLPVFHLLIVKQPMLLKLPTDHFFKYSSTVSRVSVYPFPSHSQLHWRGGYSHCHAVSWSGEIIMWQQAWTMACVVYW